MSNKHLDQGIHFMSKKPTQKKEVGKYSRH